MPFFFLLFLEGCSWPRFSHTFQIRSERNGSFSQVFSAAQGICLFGLHGFFVRCSVFIWGSLGTDGVSVTVCKSQGGPLGSCAYGMTTAYKEELGFCVPKYVSVGCRVTTPHGYLSGMLLGCLEILAKWAKSSDATRMGHFGGERGHVMGSSLPRSKLPLVS